MKLANVTPVHKKGSRYDKCNCRPVSILPNLSKVFERWLHKQISHFLISFCQNINADLCDVFITTSHYGIPNYADDNTPNVSGRNIEEVVASLEEVSEVVFQWLEIIRYRVT